MTNFIGRYGSARTFPCVSRRAGRAMTNAFSKKSGEPRGSGRPLTRYPKSDRNRWDDSPTYVYQAERPSCHSEPYSWLNLFGLSAGDLNLFSMKSQPQLSISSNRQV